MNIPNILLPETFKQLEVKVPLFSSRKTVEFMDIWASNRITIQHLRSCAKTLNNIEKIIGSKKDPQDKINNDAYIENEKKK